MLHQKLLLDAGLHSVVERQARVQRRCILLKVYNSHGELVRVQTNPPPSTRIPRIRITLTEYQRQLREHGLLRTRIKLAPEERRLRRLDSARRYRERIRIERGPRKVRYRVDAEITQIILDRLGEVNEQGAPRWSGVEISMMMGVSPSYVSRVKRGERGHGPKSSVADSAILLEREAD